jgi:hypothetical protein
LEERVIEIVRLWLGRSVPLSIGGYFVYLNLTSGNSARGFNGRTKEGFHGRKTTEEEATLTFKMQVTSGEVLFDDGGGLSEIWAGQER